MLQRLFGGTDSKKAEDDQRLIKFLLEENAKLTAQNKM